MLGTAKVAMSSKGCRYTLEVQFSANAEHVTIMPVISADGKTCTPVSILLGKYQKNLMNLNGVEQTPQMFLLPGSLVAYRNPASMDKEIFCKWAENFNSETAHLRKQPKRLLLTIDRFSCLVSFKALTLLHENDVVVVALPAHTSNRTQNLGHSVF